jgi:hypothetical protein
MPCPAHRTGVEKALAIRFPEKFILKNTAQTKIAFPIS